MKRQMSVRVDDDVYKGFKKMCVDRGESMSDVLQGLMHEEVEKHSKDKGDDIKYMEVKNDG